MILNRKKILKFHGSSLSLVNFVDLEFINLLMRPSPVSTHLCGIIPAFCNRVGNLGSCSVMLIQLLLLSLSFFLPPPSTSVILLLLEYHSFPYEHRTCSRSPVGKVEVTFEYLAQWLASRFQLNGFFHTQEMSKNNQISAIAGTPLKQTAARSFAYSIKAT